MFPAALSLLLPITCAILCAVNPNPPNVALKVNKLTQWAPPSTLPPPATHFLEQPLDLLGHSRRRGRYPAPQNEIDSFPRATATEWQRFRVGKGSLGPARAVHHHVCTFAEGIRSKSFLDFHRNVRRGLAHMALSGDSNIKGRIARQPDPELLQGWKTENRTVIFIRHGVRAARIPTCSLPLPCTLSRSIELNLAVSPGALPCALAHVIATP